MFENFRVVGSGTWSGRLVCGEMNCWHVSRLIALARRRQVQDHRRLAVCKLAVDLDVLDGAVQ